MQTIIYTYVYMPDLKDNVEVKKPNIIIEQQPITLSEQECCCHIYKRPINNYKIVELDAKTTLKTNIINN